MSSPAIPGLTPQATKKSGPALEVGCKDPYSQQPTVLLTLLLEKFILTGEGGEFSFHFGQILKWKQIMFKLEAAGSMLKLLYVDILDVNFHSLCS